MSTPVKTGDKIRAWELRGEFGIDALSLTQREVQPLGPYDVRIATRAVSLNYRDYLVVKGLYSRNLPLPLIPCSDGAGQVVETGSLVTRFKVGDRVAGIFMQQWLSGELRSSAASSALGGSIDGVLTESFVLHEDGLVLIPNHLSFEEAATLPCAAVTAWNALVCTGNIKAGDTVLTMGTGGVSLFALQFATISGARVIITSSSDDKLKRARELGASDVINYRSCPNWEKEVLKLTDGRGVDHVVELGGAGTLARSFVAVRAGGHISLIGVLAGTKSEVNPTMVLMKNICLQGIFVGSRAIFEQMNTAIALHKLKPVVNRVFDFDDAAKALCHLESQAHFGKIVIRV